MMLDNYQGLYLVKISSPKAQKSPTYDKFSIWEKSEIGKSETAFTNFQLVKAWSKLGQNLIQIGQFFNFFGPKNF